MALATGLADKTARKILELLAKGEQLNPMLRRLLLGALMDENPRDCPYDPNALTSDVARSALQWIAASPEERAKALIDLLLFTDAIGPKPDLSLPEKIVALHENLSKAKLPHAFGGAIAVAYYGEPRMAKDIDINVFISSKHWRKMSEALEPLRLNIELEDRDLRNQEDLRLEWEGTSLHLFFSCDPLHERMEGQVRTAPFANHMIPLVAPEHLVIRKAILDRTKDWLDIEQIIIGSHPLDLEEVENWMERLTGLDDVRRTKLKKIRAELEV